MTKAYLYVCASHEKLGLAMRMMTPQELAALIHEHHLDHCQVKGCQFLRDRVIMCEVAKSAPPIVKAEVRVEAALQ